MKAQHSLKVSLHGMNDRMQTMMASYFELNCNGIACVVEESEADAEIVDVDLSDSKNILQERLAQQPVKPIIAISLYDVSSSAAIYVKKPIKVHNLVNAINKVRDGFLGGRTAKNDNHSDAFMPELPVLLKQNKLTDTKKKDKTKDTTSALIEISKNERPQILSNRPIIKPGKTSVNQEKSLAKPKPQQAKASIPPSKTKKTDKLNEDSTDIVSINSSRPRPEIDKFLKEFDRSIRKKEPKKKKSAPNSVINNRRNTVRYVFQAISGCLKKNSLLGFNSNLPVIIEAISSKGALIKLEKTLKLNRKVTLEIKLDSLYSFTIPAKVIRQNSNTTYGLAFVDYQHKLTEYLIGSGRPFNIK